jgi:hypothetical protein
MARMTAQEAYQAGRADVSSAHQEVRQHHQANPYCDMYLEPEVRQANDLRLFTQALIRLWQERVDNGELPPLNETEG